MVVVTFFPENSEFVVFGRIEFFIWKNIAIWVFVIFNVFFLQKADRIHIPCVSICKLFENCNTSTVDSAFEAALLKNVNLGEFLSIVIATNLWNWLDFLGFSVGLKRYHFCSFAVIFFTENAPNELGKHYVPKLL